MVNVSSIQKACMKGKIGLPQAVSYLNNVLGGIASVQYKEGKKFKISDGNQLFPLQHQGLSRKELSRLHGLAVGAYFMAQRNGSIKPGEVHISRQASTHDHMKGIYAIRDQYFG